MSSDAIRVSPFLLAHNQFFVGYLLFLRCTLIWAVHRRLASASCCVQRSRPTGKRAEAPEAAARLAGNAIRALSSLDRTLPKTRTPVGVRMPKNAGFPWSGQALFCFPGFPVFSCWSPRRLRPSGLPY